MQMRFFFPVYLFIFSSLRDKRSFLLHFLWTPWTLCVLYSVVKIIWIDWPLTFCSCSLWCKFELQELAEAIILKVLTPVSSNHRCRLQGRGVPHDYFKDDILSGPSSAVSIGERRQSRSIVPCVHMGCKVWAVPYKLHSPAYTLLFYLHHDLHVSLYLPTSLCCSFVYMRALINMHKRICTARWSRNIKLATEKVWGWHSIFVFLN